jgi:autotransporter-associated beta strand protein
MMAAARRVLQILLNPVVAPRSRIMIFTARRRIAHARTLVFAAAALGGNGQLDAQVWDGGHMSSNDWGSGVNWNPNGPPANDGTADIIMSGTVRLTPNVDQSWDIHSLRFNLSAGAFVTGGSPLLIRAGGIENDSLNLQVFNNKIFPRSTQTWEAFSGPMEFNEQIEAFIGSPTLTIDGAFDVTFNGDVTESGVTLELAKTGSGTLTLNGSDNNYSGPTTISAGTMRVATNLTTSSAVAITGGALELAAGGGSSRVIKTGSVSVTGGGNLDLKDNKLIVAGGDVGSWNGSNYTGVAGLVDSGRGSAGNALWDGSGIVTSDTRAISNGDLLSIGVAKVSAVRSVTDTQSTTFAGQTVLGTDVIAMVTWGGDANLDGKINIDDYGRIDGNVGQSGSVFGWSRGDFNYDGKINIDDYGIIDGNINRQGAAFVTSGAALTEVLAVPEPVGVAVVALVALTSRSRRRRRSPAATRHTSTRPH